MPRMMIALLPLALVACAETTPPADAAPEAPPEALEVEVVTDESLGFTGLPLTEEIAAGREIASENCSRCHGLDREAPPRPDAPALRHILADYDSEALKEDFRDGIKVGHPDMPQFEFDPKGTDLLLSYLISIQEPETE